MNEPIEEVENVQIGDAVENRVAFKDGNSALVTLKHFLEQRLVDGALSFRANKHLKRK